MTDKKKMFKFDFEAFLSRSGVLSDLPKIAVGFCPVGFCPVGFCPSGALSQWGFVRLPSLNAIKNVLNVRVASHQRKTIKTSLRSGKSKDVVRTWSK